MNELERQQLKQLWEKRVVNSEYYAFASKVFYWDDLDVSNEITKEARKLLNEMISYEDI